MTAVIYARYSSDNQREESIEGQIRECTAYAEKNGITIVKHYIDRASPPIIPLELFEDVQEKIAKNKKAPARRKAEDDDAALALIAPVDASNCGKHPMLRSPFYLFPAQGRNFSLIFGCGMIILAGRKCVKRILYIAAM